MTNNKQMSESDDVMVREAMLEGIFYPGEERELRETLQLLLARVSPLDFKPSIVLSPHGSFEFSGAISAAAYAAVAGSSPRRVIIVAPCLHEKSSKIYLPESSVFRTPIGESLVDPESVQTLLGTSMLFETNDLPHLREHAVEIQLPFIQHIFPGVPIVPMLTGQTSESIVRALRGAIAMLRSEHDDESDLVVLSANLSAVLSKEDSDAQANSALSLMIGGNPEGLLKAHSSGTLIAEDTAVHAFFAAANARGNAKLLARSSSLPVHYDTGQVTEYAALAI